MKYFIFTVFIFIVFYASILNNLDVLYAQEKYLNNDSIKTDLKNKSIIYAYEPFFSTNGKSFEDIPHDNKFSLKEFTIAGWFKTDNQKKIEPSHIINKGGFNSDKKNENMNYGIWLSTNGIIQGGFETESGENFELNSTKKYNDGKWHYILLSYNGSLLRLDIDEKKQVKSTNGALPDTSGTQTFRIGANSLEKDKFFSGYIDEIRIWDKGLSDREISEIYLNNNFNSKNQILYEDFGGNGTRINNNSFIINNNITSKENHPSLTYNDFLMTSNKTNPSPLSANKGLDNNLDSNTSQKLKIKKNFNVAVASDWGCDQDAIKTSENIYSKNPDLVIAGGDLSYDDSASCWIDVISPFQSKLKISMGDHEYHDTEGGLAGVIDRYLHPLNLSSTYYSFDFNNVHFLFMDPYIDYRPGSAQYQFIVTDLTNSEKNSNIDWTFVVEHIPMYSSPSKHQANSTIRDIYHPIFDKYGVNLVFSGDNHNYQRTFPLRYNENGDSSMPIIVDNKLNKYNTGGGVIYIICGTAGKSHYDIENKASFVAKQDDEHFGFLNIDVSSESIKSTFYANVQESNYQNVDTRQNILDSFTISKNNMSVKIDSIL